MKRSLASAIVWTTALAGLLAAGVLASLFALMATSLDPIEAIKAGLDPWMDALYAALAFVAALVTTILALVLWHSRRFAPIGAGLALVQAIVIVWVGVQIYVEYF